MPEQDAEQRRQKEQQAQGEEDEQTLAVHTKPEPDHDQSSSRPRRAASSAVAGVVANLARTRNRRRKASELQTGERWICPNGCGRFYRFTSTTSIKDHGSVCPLAQQEDGLPDVASALPPLESGRTNLALPDSETGRGFLGRENDKGAAHSPQDVRQEQPLSLLRPLSSADTEEEGEPARRRRKPPASPVSSSLPNQLTPDTHGGSTLAARARSRRTRRDPDQDSGRVDSLAGERSRGPESPASALDSEGRQPLQSLMMGPRWPDDARMHAAAARPLGDSYRGWGPRAHFHQAPHLAAPTPPGAPPLPPLEPLGAWGRGVGSAPSSAVKQELSPNVQSAEATQLLQLQIQARAQVQALELQAHLNVQQFQMLHKRCSSFPSCSSSSTVASSHTTRNNNSVRVVACSFLWMCSLRTLHK